MYQLFHCRKKHEHRESFYQLIKKLFSSLPIACCGVFAYLIKWSKQTEEIIMIIGYAEIKRRYADVYRLVNETHINQEDRKQKVMKKILCKLST